MNRRRMMRCPRHSVIAAVAALTMAACGGSSDNSASTDAVTDVDGTTGDGDPDDEAAETSDEGSSADPGGAVDGALVSLLSLDLGLFAIERGTGEFHEISIDEAGFSDRQNQPMLVGDHAYTLTFTQLEGQSFSNMVGVSSVDRATGDGTQFVELGDDRTDDESEDLTSFTLIGADDSVAWVESKPFAESDPALITYTAYDVDSGTEMASLSNVVYEESDGSSECSDNVRDPIVTSGGQLIGVSFGWPVSIDTVTGDVTPLVTSCLDFDDPSLLSVVGLDAAPDFFVAETELPTDPAVIESLAGVTQISVSNGTFVEGDGSLWWVFNRNVSTQVDDEPVSLIAGGVVEYDMATGEIVNVYPLGDAVGEFLPEEEFGDISTMSQMDLQYLDGSLWIMDWREDQPLRRVDATTGMLTDIAIPLGGEFDALDARLIPNDPEAIWLDVTRKVVTESEEGRSSDGLGFIDQVDIATNAFVLSVSQRDIIGF